MSNPYPDYSIVVYTTPSYNVPFAASKNQIEFRDANVTNSWVMRITADRRIEVNEDVEVTESAKKVLEAIQHLLPQRTWVGLTGEELHEIIEHGHCRGDVVRATEAKLKEKNNG
jgi:hypothetical protein